MTSDSAYGQGPEPGTLIVQCEALQKQYDQGGSVEELAQLRKKMEFLWSNMTNREKDELVWRKKQKSS